MTLSQSILATFSYHDIFDYPLTAAEIHQYLIGRLVSKKVLTDQIDLLVGSKLISEKKGYYFLRGCSKIVSLRKQRQKYSKSKFKKAHFFAQVLKVIPSLKLVAISGALAMQNSHKNDDIDLVLITSRGTLWTTRFLANILLLPYKRDPKGAKVSNRACLNVLIDESDLKISPQNLYLAHEICQMKPIWDRDKTYRRFIDANKWIYKFLPNWQVNFGVVDHRSEKKKLPTTNYLLRTVESFLKNFQLWYMHPKITTEKIGKHQLFFHPQNTGEWVMEEYQKRLIKLKLKNNAVIPN